MGEDDVVQSEDVVLVIVDVTSEVHSHSHSA